MRALKQSLQRAFSYLHATGPGPVNERKEFSAGKRVAVQLSVALNLREYSQTQQLKIELS
jgi:hypothetical protein